MAPSSKQFHSSVADLIKFEPLEDPPWRSEQTEVPKSVSCMIKDIVQFQQQWNTRKEDCNAFAVKKEFLHRFILHCNIGEGQGCQTEVEVENCFQDNLRKNSQELGRNFTVSEQETLNLKDAYMYLLNIAEEETDLESRGLIEESMLRNVNRIILQNLPLTNRFTKPGVYSNKRRVTTFNGEVYEYPQPEDMHNAVNTLLDQFNSLFVDSQSEPHAEKRLEKLFKACSWLVFEMLDLHPFADGNGRLCRLLCSYVLSTCTPFPTPMYNIWSDSCQDDFKQALVDARKSQGRHPRALTTMLIECSWSGWKHFMEKLDGSVSKQDQSARKDIPEEVENESGKSGGFVNITAEQTSPVMAEQLPSIMTAEHREEEMFASETSHAVTCSVYMYLYAFIAVVMSQLQGWYQQLTKIFQFCSKKVRPVRFNPVILHAIFVVVIIHVVTVHSPAADIARGY